MQQVRKHHFDDGAVITGLCDNGQFGARLEEGNLSLRGYGHSRYAAIADLAEKLPDSDDEDFDHEAARADHIVSLRREA